MKWFVFWVIKYSATLILWYCLDDRLAAHFGNPALGSVPIFIVVGIVLFLSLCGEQYSVMRAYEAGR